MPAGLGTILFGEGGRALTVTLLDVVKSVVESTVLYVDLGAGVPRIRFTVAFFEASLLEVATISVVEAVVLVNANVLFNSHASTWGFTVSIFFSDADVFTRVAVVSTGRVGLRLSVSAFPSSVLDCYTFFALDLSGLGRCLLVFV